MRKLLFLCTGNSCRSQMAEGFGRAHLVNRWQVFSAGVEAHGMNSYAIQVMKEIGIDITQQHSKTINKVPWADMDVIVTLCDHAAEKCPTIPVQALHIHWGLEDPARTKGSHEEILQKYRQVRDEIRSRVLMFKLQHDNQLD